MEDRVDGTCQWFLKHENFQGWLQQKSGPILVTADPGCGKSVLAKYLVDHALPQLTTRTTICYFFFKDQDQNTIRKALCALLHQLFSHKPSLIEHAMTAFQKDGKGLIDSTESLWQVLRSAVKDPRAGPIILVLDALDECAESEFENLATEVQRQFSSDQIKNSKLKYLMTSRPYEQIVYQFRDYDLLEAFPDIRVPGEEESETISLEVNLVITHRVNLLSEKMKLSVQVQNHLEKRLRQVTHRTYLWLYLVFDYLESRMFKKTLKGVEDAISTLPRSVNEAYECILNRSKEEEPMMARKALSIVLAASRPLTVSEMNAAMNIDENSQSIHELDLEDDEDFQSRLRSCCGLFVSIYQRRIYFLHQTAREFLLADLALPATIPSGLSWHHSITILQAHTVLVEACVLYLNLINSDEGIMMGADGKLQDLIDTYSFLGYSAMNWGAHFREASIYENCAIISHALRIFNPTSTRYDGWFQIYWRATYAERARSFTDLMVASYFGHRAIAKLLLETGADTEVKDGLYGRTPLSWAANQRNDTLVQLLVEKGADIEAKEEDSQTPLLRAAMYGNEAMVRLLVEKGADIEARDKDGQTPLLQAVGYENEAMVWLLVEKGANIEAQDDIESQTPLSWAAELGNEAIVRILLEKGADIETKNNEFGQTPLSLAAEKGHEAVVRLLLDKGADIEAKDESGRTPLSCAAYRKHEALVRVLVEKGADIEAKDEYGQTPLSFATKNGHESLVQLLQLKPRSMIGVAQ